MAKPDRIFASELLEREVMDLRAGEIVGAVTDFNVTREGVVTQLGVLPLQWYRGGRGIAPGAITNVTRERVSIEDSTLLAEFDPDGETGLSAMFGDNLYGKPVLQADGELLGTLADFAFDLGDGRITDIVVYGEEDKRSKIGVERIQTIGKSYIVISRSGSAAEVAPGPKMAAPSAQPEVAAASTAPAAPQAEELPESLETSDEFGPHTEEPELEELLEEVTELEHPTVAHEPAQATPKPLPEIDEHSAGAALAPEPPMKPLTEAPVFEESEPPAPVAEPPVRRSRGRQQTEEVEPVAPSAPATGRRSRPATESATGRASRPRTTIRQPQQQLELTAEAASPPAPVAENLDGLGLSTFDRRKAEYLLGKAAHRDVRSASGGLVLGKGSAFDRASISALLEQGLLNSVFLEMTQHKD